MHPFKSAELLQVSSPLRLDVVDQRLPLLSLGELCPFYFLPSFLTPFDVYPAVCPSFGSRHSFTPPRCQYKAAVLLPSWNIHSCIVVIMDDISASSTSGSWTSTAWHTWFIALNRTVIDLDLRLPALTLSTHSSAISHNSSCSSFLQGRLTNRVAPWSLHLTKSLYPQTGLRPLPCQTSPNLA